MRNVTVFCGPLACSWNEVTGLDSDGEPRYLFAFVPVPSLDFFPLDLQSGFGTLMSFSRMGTRFRTLRLGLSTTD